MGQGKEEGSPLTERYLGKLTGSLEFKILFPGLYLLKE
jgi:hypothetical protein